MTGMQSQQEIFEQRKSLIMRYQYQPKQNELQLLRSCKIQNNSINDQKENKVKFSDIK